MKNWRKWLLGLALVAFLSDIGWTAYAGGYGFMDAPSFTVSVPAPAHTPQQIPASDKPTPKADLPCGGKPGPIVYYANDPSAARYNDFGTSLVPGLNPLYESYGKKPDAKAAVQVLLNRVCHDPYLARAVVAAVDPYWIGLRETTTYQPFDWMAAIKQIYQFDWADAMSVYKATSPTPWTMRMLSSGQIQGVPAPPTTQIVLAQYNGWYIDLPLGNGFPDELFRMGCGGQPTLDIHRYQALLVAQKLFELSA